MSLRWQLLVLESDAALFLPLATSIVAAIVAEAASSDDSFDSCSAMSGPGSG